MKSWFMAGSAPKDYEHDIDTNTTYEGKNVAYLKSIVDNAAGFGTLMQMFKADDYRNKRMCLSAAAKSEGIEGGAGLWMRIDGPEQKLLGFDNMQNRPIKGTTDWHKYEVVLDVPPESVNIAFGILLEGKGQVWLSDVQFGEVGLDVPTTSLEEHGELPDTPGNLDFAEDGVGRGITQVLERVSPLDTRFPLLPKALHAPSDLNIDLDRFLVLREVTPHLIMNTLVLRARAAGLP